MSKATDLADLAVSEARAGTDPTRCLAIAIAALTHALAEPEPTSGEGPG
jgi:hypothetical protein